MTTRRGSGPLAYPARLEEDQADGGYVVTFPDFGVGVTQGDDREEALAQAADLLETMVANYLAEGWDLPDPSPARGRPPAGRDGRARLIAILQDRPRPDPLL